MEFSRDTEMILTYLDNYAPNGLRKRNDLGALLELGAQTGAAEEFNQLVFTGKIVWNLYTTWRKAGSGKDSSVLQQEFAATVHTLREYLIPFVAHASDEIRERFEKIYLGTNDGTLRNIVDLAYDLARMKDVQSEQKR